MVCGGRARDNKHKLEEERFRLPTRENFPTMRMIKHWNSLPRDVVDIFKSWMDKSMSNLV